MFSELLDKHAGLPVSEEAPNARYCIFWRRPSMVTMEDGLDDDRLNSGLCTHCRIPRFDGTSDPVRDMLLRLRVVLVELFLIATKDKLRTCLRR